VEHHAEVLGHTSSDVHAFDGVRPRSDVNEAGLEAAAAVIVAKASFAQIDTTQASGWKPPILKQVAGDYADAVKLGEVTVADRVTVFRQATRFLIWGAVLTTAAVLVAV
jgi:hypothetical protein